ncbi:MAG: PadR family transcriptional regulator [Clostridia bacterium]|nr:PadR family transcriptional regulator [Clostridia bacterium]
MENTIQSDLIRGHINTIILKALFDGDRYGYDIVREIEQKSSGQYKLKQPTLYSCLKRLEIQGFIRSYWGAKSNGGRRKYFTLTDMGRELFIKNQSEWEYSRTVIDKLISDREVNLNDYHSENNDSDSESEQAESVGYDETAEESESDIFITTTDVSAEHSEEQIGEIIVGDAIQPAPEQIPEQEVVFSDTTAIMNELFRRQTDVPSDASYAEKLVSEKYVSDRTAETFSSDTYFRDFFDSNETSEDSENEEQAEQKSHLSPVSEESVQPEPVSDPQSETANVSPTDRFLDYHTSQVAPRPENAIIEREYRNILGEFLNASFSERRTPPAEEPQRNDQNVPTDTQESLQEEQTQPTLAENHSEIETNDYPDEQIENTLESYTADADVNKKLNRLTGEVREMGDNVVIRTHNSTGAKEHNNTYYYYSNKLMLVHYGILFAVMMLEILFTAVFINPILKAGQSTDKWFYIIATVVAVTFPAVAFVKNFTAPNKRKRINFNMKNSLIYRLIVMAQCFLIIYCLNIIGGMPLSFSKEYLTTLLLPALLCTGFPVSAFIFNALFKTKKFAVEQ